MGALETRKVAQIAAACGLGVLLSLVRIYRMPYGGSITLEAVPIYILALRDGPKVGMTAGAILGFLQLIIDPYIIHPLQLVLDYPLAFGLLGISGFFTQLPFAGIIIGGLARGSSHFLSGVIFFGEYATQGTPVWIYSALYNGSYVIPEILIALFMVPVLIKRLRAAEL